VSKRTRNRARRSVERERNVRDRDERQLKETRLKGFEPVSTGDMLSLVSKQPMTRRSGRR
jgi:hypothetical protein